MRIVAVVNARSNYACLKTVLLALKEKVDLKIIVGGSASLRSYGGIPEIIQGDGLSVDVKLYSMIQGDIPEVMVKSMAMSSIDLSTAFDQLKPDGVLIVGDRFETLAAAVAASYMNIPLIHVQGGELSGSIDEKIRHAITKLADLHFPATEKARQNIISMGEAEDKVHCMGCPSIDLLKNLKPVNPEVLMLGSGYEIDIENPFLMVLQHPVTTEYDKARGQILETLWAIQALYIQTIWLWPNIDSGSDAISKTLRQFGNGYIRYFKNFAAEDYGYLLSKTRCLVGNSSSGLRSGSYLGTPCVNIGTRQIHREHAANVFHAGHDAKDIESAIRTQLKASYKPSFLYGDGNAGERIATIIASSTLTHTKVLYGV